MWQNKSRALLSALEHFILDTLRTSSKPCATIAELAHCTQLPEGAIHFGLQWLEGCRLVRYDGECYYLCTEGTAS